MPHELRMESLDNQSYTMLLDSFICFNSWLLDYISVHDPVVTNLAREKGRLQTAISEVVKMHENVVSSLERHYCEGQRANKTTGNHAGSHLPSTPQE
jgi:hypothetical protein